jgi:hypothetical protein
MPKLGVAQFMKSMGTHMALTWRRWILMSTQCPHCMLTKNQVRLRGYCPFSQCVLGLKRPPETFSAKWPEDRPASNDLH